MSNSKRLMVSNSKHMQYGMSSDLTYPGRTPTSTATAQQEADYTEAPHPPSTIHVTTNLGCAQQAPGAQSMRRHAQKS